MNEDTKKVKDSLIKQVEELERAALHVQNVNVFIESVSVTTSALKTLILLERSERKQQQSETDRTALADALKEILLEQAKAASKSKGSAAMNDITTKELVDELSQREGIEKIIAEPYQDMEVKINGPTIVLVVRD